MIVFGFPKKNLQYFERRVRHLAFFQGINRLPYILDLLSTTSFAIGLATTRDNNRHNNNSNTNHSHNHNDNNNSKVVSVFLTGTKKNHTKSVRCKLNSASLGSNQAKEAKSKMYGKRFIPWKNAR